MSSAKRWTVAGWLVCSFAMSVGAQQPAAESEEATPPKGAGEALPARASSRASEDLLRKRVDHIDWQDKTFEDVLQWLREEGEGRVNVVPRWGPLGVENINRESLVTLQLNNTTIADALDEAFGQLSEDNEIRYRGVANKLTISTRQDFERKLHTQIYDVTDMMFRVPDFGRTAPQIDLQRTKSGGGGSGGGGGGQSVFGGGGGSSQQDQESGQQAEQEIEERLQKLRDLIQNSIARETWDRTGQEGSTVAAGAVTGQGRIEIFNRALVITNTIEVHEMIAGRFAFGN